MLIRLVSLGILPLMDTTEARYGEQARIMVETGNWLTPMFDYDEPFLGKPPMFTWLSAVGIEVFGVSEFAVRFPHWVVGVLTIALGCLFAKRVGINPLKTAVVMATIPVFSISSGAVMTDMALTFSLTLAMVGFFFCWRGEKIWGYVGFAGLGLALLAKGPMAIVLMGLSVLPFLIIQHGFIGAFVQLWKRFPIVGGLILMCVIALPWYILAEQANPGFLEYFIVGEHFNRFLVSGWEGDRYGDAHDEPRGMIWLFLMLAALPWSIVLPLLAVFRFTRLKEKFAELPGVFVFLLFWVLSPLILFTFSGNILATYVLPGMPAFALLVAYLAEEKVSFKATFFKSVTITGLFITLVSVYVASELKNDAIIGYVAAIALVVSGIAFLFREKAFTFNWFIFASYILPIILIIVICVVIFKVGNERSDKMLFVDIDRSKPTFYVEGSRTFSGQYYSFGQAKRMNKLDQLKGHENGYYIIGPNERIEGFINKYNLACTLEVASPKRSRYLCQ
uniref:ArnT family glycosyltransferase n=1 Tax=Vibrio sp. S9_S30 TaxID=2720226 RepID=UPI001EEF2E67|nr:glycosyltransferase family 39 protein [Vibrio sp. S9_S30]